MKTVLLIRHGETAAPKGVFCGSTNVTLSTIGKRQSQEIVNELAGRGVQLVLTTGLQRTDYCGELAAQNGIAHIVEPDFREIDFGAWEGLTWDDIKTANPNAAEAWLEHPEAMRFPNGEAMAHFQKRIQNAWRRMLARPEETVAIIGHSGALSYLLQYIEAAKEPVYLQHGEIVEVRLEAFGNGVVPMTLKS